MAMVGMAGTAVGVGIAVLKEKADRRSIQREAEAEIAELDKQDALEDSSNAAVSGDASVEDEEIERSDGDKDS